MKPRLRRNEQASRFELELDGEVAGFINYRESGGRLHLVHTEVSPSHEGKGLGGELARFALEEARGAGKQVVASCSFVAGWIERHPEYQPLVAG